MLLSGAMRRFFILTSVFWILTSALPAHAEPRPINDVYVVHFVLDGMNRRAFNEMLDAGKLPNIKEHLVDHGAVFSGALSHFPSTSTTVYQSYVSGLLPGNSGIPHLERFDRRTRKVTGYLTTSGYLKINSDFINLAALQNPDAAELNPPSTIYELLSGHPTYSLYASFRRGAADYFPRKVPMHAIWSAFVTDNGEKIDHLAYERLFKAFERAEIPRYTLVGLYSADFQEHEFGVESDEAKNAVIQFDVFLKEFLELLKKRGIADRTYIILSSDHGMHDTGKLFDLQEPLIRAGVFVKPHDPKIKDYTLYAADRGISSTHIYVKHDGSWEPIQDAQILRRHPKRDGGNIDLIKTLTGLEPSMFVIARDGERAARVFDTKSGESRIECFDLNYIDWCSYNVIVGGDPLNYAGKKHLAHLTDGTPHSAVEWMKATANEEYPNAVVELAQIFRDGRAGDLFLIPTSEWGFKKAKAATHGSIIFDDMRVVMLMSGPTVPAGNFGVMRSGDVYPLLLKWFGIQVAKENYDGIDPLANTVPESKDWQRLATLEQRVAHGEQARATGSLSKLARDELEMRTKLLEKLGSYYEKISKTDKSDRVDIVKRALELTQERIERMQKIVGK
jgi:hypothetical protein